MDGCPVEGEGGQCTECWQHGHPRHAWAGALGWTMWFLSGHADEAQGSPRSTHPHPEWITKDFCSALLQGTAARQAVVGYQAIRLHVWALGAIGCLSGLTNL